MPCALATCKVPAAFAHSASTSAAGAAATSRLTCALPAPFPSRRPVLTNRQAEAHLREAYARCVGAFGKSDHMTLKVARVLASMLKQEGRDSEASVLMSSLVHPQLAAAAGSHPLQHGMAHGLPRPPPSIQPTRTSPHSTRTCTPGAATAGGAYRVRSARPHSAPQPTCSTEYVQLHQRPVLDHHHHQQHYSSNSSSSSTTTSSTTTTCTTPTYHTTYTSSMAPCSMPPRTDTTTLWP